MRVYLSHRVRLLNKGHHGDLISIEAIVTDGNADLQKQYFSGWAGLFALDTL